MPRRRQRMQYLCALCRQEVAANALEAECIVRGRRVLRLVCNDACLAALMSCYPAHRAQFAGRGGAGPALSEAADPSSGSREPAPSLSKDLRPATLGGAISAAARGGNQSVLEFKYADDELLRQSPPGRNQSVLELKYPRDDFRIVFTCAWTHPRVTRHGVYCACGAGALEAEWARRGRCAVCYYEAHPHEGICAKCGEYLGFKTISGLCNRCRDRAARMAAGVGNRLRGRRPQ